MVYLLHALSCPPVPTGVGACATDEVLQQLASSCPHLQSLCLTMCTVSSTGEALGKPPAQAGRLILQSRRWIGYVLVMTPAPPQNVLSKTTGLPH